MSHNETSGRRRRHLSTFLESSGFKLVERAQMDNQPPLSETWEKSNGPVLFTLTMMSFTADDRATVRNLVHPGNMERAPEAGKPIKESEGFPITTTDGTITFDVKPNLRFGAAVEDQPILAHG